VTSASPDDRHERTLETIEARVGVARLPRLVILAAEDHEVVPALRLDPNVVIRIGRIPEQRVGNASLLHACADNVAGVSTRALSWNIRRADEAGIADEAACASRERSART